MIRPISQILAERILLLDGGFGTMMATYDLQSIPADQRQCNDQLALTAPHIVEDIHRRYLDAGADIIETDSFNANAISLADYGLEHHAYDISKAAAQVARRVADEYREKGRECYVAGSVGPTNRTLSMSADVNSPAARQLTFKDLYEAYKTQIQGLIDGGVDLIIVETVFDTLNAKAALSALRDISPDMPVMVSATVSDASGRTLTGQTVEAFCASVMHARPISLGLNCGFGAKHLLPYLRRVAQASPVAVSVHPNAGLPNVLGQYDETPEKFAADVKEYLAEGLVNIVGGCCGTTPDHIRALKEIVGNYAPRPLPVCHHICTLSGLEPLSIRPETNFVNVGERTNVAGSAKFARLIREGAYDEALSIARAQVEAGAQIVDVCMDDAMIDGVQAMTHFLNLMASEPEVARVPVMIDSSKWEVIEAGLQCTQGKSVVNSISLKEGEEVFLDHARKIMNYGAAAVVMLFDQEGQADTYERKCAVAQRAYRLLESIGFPAEDIIFDPNILAVATGMPEHDRYAHDFIEATRWIKANLPHAKVSGGVSNLSFAFRGNNQVRKAMHAVFLYHAIGAGMDMAIVNPQMVQLYDDIDPELLARVEDLILYRRPDAADRLIDFAKQLADAQVGVSVVDDVAQWRSLPLADRIDHAMLKGDTDFIEEDALTAYAQMGSAVGVIESLLMPSMVRVGQLFAQGKMFLPQVVKSARVMKKAVAALEPFFGMSAQPHGEAERHSRLAQPNDEKTCASGSLSSDRRVVIATVKGDVHDIGKNIVSVVLSCNGYDVHDLGVMTPAETIVAEAIRLNAGAICLSGLITPSLDEMIEVAREAERQHLNIPIVVGGATTSAIHTAIKIAPVTSAPVIHSTDAADNARIMGHLFGVDREEFLARVSEEQVYIRADYESKKHGVGCACCSIPKPERVPSTQQLFPALTVLHPSVSEVAAAINWSFFFAGWGIKGRYPDILDDAVKGEEAQKLYADAQHWLARLAESQEVKLQGVVQTFSAYSDGDDIVIDGPGFSRHRLPMMRDDRGDCVADLLAASGNKVTLFALTAGIGASSLCDKLRKAGDDYAAIMVKLLCDRLAEAFADTMLKGGRRLAIGYPSIPDHALKRDVFDLLDVEAHTGMSLTETYMINPGESVCGIYLIENK